jgi:hypothetical protein
MAKLRTAATRAEQALHRFAERRADRAYSRAQSGELSSWHRRGRAFAEQWPPSAGDHVDESDGNPLRTFFDARTEGRGIWKWEHYFDLYHRHFARFRNREVHILEIGIYSGGSLDMWHDYFGEGCHVYGVDNQPECKRYEDASTSVFIGDQADRAFWEGFRHEVPKLDIVVDDGGHQPSNRRRRSKSYCPTFGPEACTWSRTSTESPIPLRRTCRASSSRSMRIAASRTTRIRSAGR